MSEKKKGPADHIKEGDGYADITLSRPAEFNGVKTGTVRMREPTVADMERFQDSKDSEATREITTFANLCECSPDDVRRLPVRDYARFQAAYVLFTS